MMRMRQSYLLEWLDILANVTLNPEKTPVQDITGQQVIVVMEKIRKETATIKSKLKHRVFSLTREKHIRVLLQNHYTSTQILLARVTQHKKNKTFQQEDLKRVLTLLEASLQDLLSFLETWFARYLNLEQLSKRKRNNLPITSPEEKILCSLSTDQTALVLRAADELRILKAKSMRSVFRTIVPYLATPHRQDLSYDSLRAKAYTPEEKDKEIAIAQLQRMIKKIREY